MLKTTRSIVRGTIALLAMSCLAGSGYATTLQRQGLEDLVAHHDVVVVGEVVDAFSYWNDESTMILTDVTLEVERFVQGDSNSKELTVTLLGGTVGDLSTVILGGAELMIGRSYLLFVSEENLQPGLSKLTVREHCQGAFDIVEAKGGDIRVISQANDEDLVPDASGETKVPGGVEGLLLEDILETIYALQAKEVK